MAIVGPTAAGERFGVRLRGGGGLLGGPLGISLRRSGAEAAAAGADGTEGRGVRGGDQLEGEGEGGGGSRWSAVAAPAAQGGGPEGRHIDRGQGRSSLAATAPLPGPVGTWVHLMRAKTQTRDGSQGCTGLGGYTSS